MTRSHPTTTDELIRQALTELADGPDAGQLQDDVVRAVDAMPQARTSLPGFGSGRLSIRNPASAVPVIAVIAIAGFAAVTAFGPGRDEGSGPVTSPDQQSPQAPSQTPTTPASPIDTRSWTTYESERYGWTIGHPAGWTVIPAEHDWTLSGDAGDVMSSGQEMFMAPSGDLRVSAWSVAFDSGQRENPETRAPIEAWIERYCEQASGVSCGAALDRAVPLCLEARDCHPGLLVPFPHEIQAFFGHGIYEGQLVVVTVWRGEDEPAVAPYGGSQRLLEAFISTMAVWPQSVPFEDRQCFGQSPFCIGS